MTSTTVRRAAFLNAHPARAVDLVHQPEQRHQVCLFDGPSASSTAAPVRGLGSEGIAMMPA